MFHSKFQKVYRELICEQSLRYTDGMMNYRNTKSIEQQIELVNRVKKYVQTADRHSEEFSEAHQILDEIVMNPMAKQIQQIISTLGYNDNNNDEQKRYSHILGQLALSVKSPTAMMNLAKHPIITGPAALFVNKNVPIDILVEAYKNIALQYETKGKQALAEQFKENDIDSMYTFLLSVRNGKEICEELKKQGFTNWFNCDFE